MVLAAPKGPAKLRVALDRAAFAGRSMPGPARLHRLDGSSADVSGDSQEIILAANDVAVWEA